MGQPLLKRISYSLESHKKMSLITERCSSTHWFRDPGPFIFGASMPPGSMLICIKLGRERIPIKSTTLRVDQSILTGEAQRPGDGRTSHGASCFFLKICMYVCMCLSTVGLSCDFDLCLWHVESSTPTRDWTQAPCKGECGVSVTGPPGKFRASHFWFYIQVNLCLWPSTQMPSQTPELSTRTRRTCCFL